MLSAPLKRYRKPNFRAVKMAREIQITLSALLQKGVIKDVRVQKYDVTVTQVTCSDDLKHAQVYVSCLGIQKPSLDMEQQLVAGLRHAKRFIMLRLNKKLGLFRAPELVFKMDHQMYEAQRIVDLINHLSSSVPAGS